MLIKDFKEKLRDFKQKNTKEIFINKRTNTRIQEAIALNMEMENHILKLVKELEKMGRVLDAEIGIDKLLKRSMTARQQLEA